MPRRLKLYKVSKVEHGPTGTVIVIHYDRNIPAFTADVRGIEVRAKTEAECRQLALDECERQATYEWIKIIVVHTKDRFGDHREHSAYLNFDVHEVAEKPGAPGRWVERYALHGRHGEPERPPAIRDYRGEVPGHRAHDVHDRGSYVLPWSAATEAALADVRDRVDALADRLRKLVGSPDAPALLVAHASRLLPPADAAGASEASKRQDS